LVALNNAYVRIGPYTHHLRIVLFDQVGPEMFREICRIVECQPCPIRVARVYVDKFENETCLRGDLSTHMTCSSPSGDAIERSSSASQLLRTFSLELPKHLGSEMPKFLSRACLRRKPRTVFFRVYPMPSCHNHPFADAFWRDYMLRSRTASSDAARNITLLCRTLFTYRVLR